MIDNKRRQLMAAMSFTTVFVPVSALMKSLPASAEESPMVDELSVGARNWEYMSISDKAQKSCSNCALYQGDINEISGPCPLFPHMRVSVDAWCNAYSPTPG